VIRSRENGNAVALVPLDLSKVCDTLNHFLLLSYLCTCKYQKVILGESQFSLQFTTSSVAQCSYVMNVKLMVHKISIFKGENKIILLWLNFDILISAK
jgi:hypothetical protein